MNLSDVHDALADVLDTLDGLRGLPYMPEQINPPAAFIETSAINYLFDQSPAGMQATLSVVLLVTSADMTRSLTALDPYLSTEGALSIFQAVETDPTLGGVVDSAIVEGVAEVGLFELAGSSYVGARLTVEVMG